MSEEKSIAEICRDYITQKHNDDAEYWNKVSINQRNRDFKFFCDNSKDKVNYEKHHSVFTQQIKKLSKELKIKPTTQREPSTAPTKRFQTTTGSQKGDIIVAPKPSSDQTTTGTGLQAVGGTEQGKQETKIPHPTGCQCFECRAKKGDYEFLDIETCGAIPDILIDLWHARNSNVRPLSDDEVRRVGRALRPLFARYVGQDILLFLTPIIVVGQILSSRYSQAKEGKPNKKKSYSDEPDEGSNIDEIEKDTSPTRRKFFSSRKVDAIRKDADSDD